MSIGPLLSNASGRAAGLMADWWLVILLAASFAGAVLAGVVPPRRVSGPDRVAPDRPAWLLLGVMFSALGVYLFSTSLYITLKQSASAPAATQPQELTAFDNAFVSTVPSLLGFLTLLLGDAVVCERTGQDLGIGLCRAPRGIIRGLIGAVIVIPPLFLIEDVVEAIYRRLNYRHPTEHPLLHLLRGKPGPGVVAAIVVGACVIAPLFEELLFRGHLQTLIRRMLYRLSNRANAGTPLPPPPPRGFPVITASGLEIAPPPAPADFVPPAPPDPPTAVQTWTAIMLTSAIFASVHPKWSIPVIFVLAVALGYAYERTGNLWVPITIHAAFNTISTVVFLTTM